MSLPPSLRRISGIFVSALLTSLSALAADIPIPLGPPVSGSIDEPGAQTRYTFTGAVGQRVLFDALNSDPTQIYLTLTSPSGIPISYWSGANVHSDIPPTTLPESGAYTLVVDGSGPAVGAYSFAILDLTNVPELPLDSITTETLSPGNSVRLYRFAGTPGQRLYFDALGVNSGGAWALYSPAAISPAIAPIAGSQIGADFETTLTQAGTYLLVLYGSSPTSVIYSFQAVSYSINQRTLNLGANVAGAIANPGDQEVFTFTGTPGQRVIYDALDGDNLQINARLLSPSGLTVWERNSDTDVEPTLLSEAGVYSLVIDGINSATGPYRFRLLDVANLPVLNLDTVVTDTLSPGIAAKAYRFEGTAGQRLFLDGLGVNSGGLLYLYSPNNTLLSTTTIGGDLEVTLPLSGRYVLVAWGTNPAGPLPFSFQVVTSDVITGTLTLGSSVTGVIAEVGEQRLFTFNGSVGQRIYYDSLDLDSEQIYSRLVSPSGAIVWDFTNQSSDLGPGTLTENGLYTLIIDGAVATTGDFTFRVLDLAASTPIVLNATTSGSLNPSTATATYQINGTAGQRLHFDNLTATVNQANWRLIGPVNQTVAGPVNITADLGEVVLPMNGAYVLLVEGYSVNVAPLQFQFKVSDLSEAPVPASGLGVIREGTLAAGQQVTNTFTAPAGLWVYFDSQDRSNFGSILAELRDPLGALVFSYYAGQDTPPGTLAYALPRSGTYQMIVKGSSPSAAGPYRYRLLDLNSGVPTLTLNTTVSGNLDPGYRTDIYQFTGQTGQRLLYDALENDFANVTVRLMLPDGQIRFISGNADSDVAPFTLPFAGTYRIFFENQTSAPATYSARLLDLASQPSLTFETLVSRTLDPGLATAVYQFAGQPGQRLYFDGLPTSGPGSWYLYGPNNEQIGGAGFTGDFEVVTPNSGRHLLVLYGSNPSASGVTFEVFAPGSGIPGGGFLITSMEVANGGVTATWVSTPGQKYRLQSKPSLDSTTWTDIPGDVTAAATTASKSDPTGGGATHRFYQVITVP